MVSYAEFLSGKKEVDPATGFDIDREALNSGLFDFQKDIVRWALKRGRAAIFAGTGLGKTRMQAEWAAKVCEKTHHNVLILAPLAVASQTVNEGRQIGYSINLCRAQADVKPGLNITNYEMLAHFDPNQFSGVVLDESSILKSFTGKIRTQIIESFKALPFRLACTATPAPNDYMELGNHSEFLGVMPRTEMLSMYFIHDGGNTSKWRLKGHAENEFWEWVASWGVMLEKPSDLGYPDAGYDLPPLTVRDHVIPSDGPDAKTLMERKRARRETCPDRVAACAELVNASDQPYLIWCDLNIESDLLHKAIPDSVEVKGSDKPEKKIQAFRDFETGAIRVMITKPSIAGFGLNWQHCANMAFVGLSDSFEQVFQAIRRCYRFGQTKPVNAHMIVSSREGATAENIKRKEADFKAMLAQMVHYTKEISSANIRSAHRDAATYEPAKTMRLPNWLRTVDYMTRGL